MLHPDGRPAPGAPAGRPDYSQAPFLVIWETTRACDLACRHCRAEACPWRDVGELSTIEAIRMMNVVRQFGRIVFVLSGGDCLKRPDVITLVEHGAQIGLRMAATPAATPLATPALLQRLARAGLARLAVSIDGSCPAIHDAFRGVDGAFAESLRVLRDASVAGIGTQVNTVIGRHNIDDLEALCTLMAGLGIVFWEVFFLVPIGRADRDDVASAAEFEHVFHRLHDLARDAPFDIKVTAAPHHARVALQRRRQEQRAGMLPADFNGAHDDGIGRARNVTEGNGFVFVSHTGEIMPSGFLPLAAGNVRTDDITDVYREHPLFVGLRDRSRLEGKCGVCEYRALCGGSRARAWAMTGNVFAEEPFCAYVPRTLALSGVS